MSDTDILQIYLKCWARDSKISPNNRPENKVEVHREYTVMDTAYHLSWSIRDTRETNTPLEPFFLQKFCDTLHLQREVELTEREVINPQGRAMLAKM